MLTCYCMKIDSLDWIDWLHSQRERSEAERKRRGISGAEWPKEIRARAEAYVTERASHDTPVARDRLATKSPSRPKP
jgi:hypothetical protein